MPKGKSKLSKLASAILADRIVPTIDQIKAIAEAVISKAKGKKAKKKKK